MWFQRNKDAHTNNTGAAAELRAEHYLQQQGLTTRAKNYRTKQGEIDLIMSEGATLIFVEVRLRSNKQFTSAAETVDYRKQQKLIKTAQQFLQEQGLLDKASCRFDVIALNKLTDDNAHIDWIKNAFGA
jgi:putative endonuclease